MLDDACSSVRAHEQRERLRFGQCATPMQKPLTTAEKAAIARRVERKADASLTHVNPRAVAMAREAAMAFLEADVDGDQRLDWNEFYSGLPHQVTQKHSKTAIREIFEMCDLDKSGFITMDEYFLFTISIAENIGF